VPQDFSLALAGLKSCPTSDVRGARLQLCVGRTEVLPSIRGTWRTASALRLAGLKSCPPSEVRGARLQPCVPGTKLCPTWESVAPCRKGRAVVAGPPPRPARQGGRRGDLRVRGRTLAGGAALVRGEADERRVGAAGADTRALSAADLSRAEGRLWPGTIRQDAVLGDSARLRSISRRVCWIAHQSLCWSRGIPHSTHTRTRALGSERPNRKSFFSSDMQLPSESTSKTEERRAGFAAPSFSAIFAVVFTA
jgi:hypothetical protein